VIVSILNKPPDKSICNEGDAIELTFVSIAIFLRAMRLEKNYDPLDGHDRTLRATLTARS
jgi:hypothetical protein